jgi:mannose-6-phosphate isomerase-like protein (cupin superfamily)
VQDKVNLREKLALFEEPFSPRIVARMNDYKVQLGKLDGEFVWHSHPETDDFFLVLEGEVEIDLPDRTVTLREGELYVVPAGVEHRPRSRDKASILLIEPMGTVNTGDAPPGELTAPEQTI